MNATAGLLLLGLSITAACGSAPQSRIAEVALWLPPGAVAVMVHRRIDVGAN